MYWINLPAKLKTSALGIEMQQLCAVLDSCVLFQAPLRDLLMRMAVLDVFRARWSNMIHEEWMRNLHERRPDIPADRIERTRDLMNAHVREGLVSHFKHLIPTIHLPDPGDRHVVALARYYKAECIVTYILRDFPREELDTFHIVAIHPDEFLTECIGHAPSLCHKALSAQQRALNNPPMSIDMLLHCFDLLSLNRAADAFRDLASFP